MEGVPGGMRIYVATSWRNEQQPMVVSALRADGHEVYDFRGEEGFSWREVDPEWQSWTPEKYIEGLLHPCAERGFDRDMKALRGCQALVMVMPCGPSASMEMGWAVGAGRPVAVYIAGMREPDLMVKMASIVTDDLRKIRDFLLFRPIRTQRE
jgi:hypothetical protein